MHTPRSITLVFLSLLLAVSCALYYPQQAATEAKAKQLAAVLASATEPVSLDARTKSASCAGHDNSPDHACTPGAVFPDVTLAKICTRGYTQTVRNVPTKLRLQVFAEYGIPYPQPSGSYEVDHLIPLAIGGSNDIANLFPQPAEPVPGFREKDLVEVYLQDEVCARRADLHVAQVRIADNWLAIYDNIPPETLAAIKAKYHNWSN